MTRKRTPDHENYLCLISVHGLIRGSELELGRDADTGGQTLYVVEQARALARQPGVSKVDLLTRLVDDPAVDDSYSQPREQLAKGAQIVRIEAGPPGYIPKEELWDYLDSFVDNTISYLRDQPRLPDVIHSHYADAGYVGSRVAHSLGIPLIHTGHSLGRVKRRRLLASGLDAAQIEESYAMSRRIEAEENTLASAECVITSTNQEIEEQYGIYDFYQPQLMQIIPPGTDLTRFHPPDGSEPQTAIAAEISRFLTEAHKPMVLALSRPDARKNISGLITAFGEDLELRKIANLVIVAGNRDDIGDLDTGAHDVLIDILQLIDRYDLYGHAAYPKHHTADDVPVIYRLPGLTLLEAAASGLPIIATEDGGPRDIIDNCNNGLLIDPLDNVAIADTIKAVLLDDEAWQVRVASGIKGVRKHYSWDAHAQRYLEMVRPIIERTREPLIRPPQRRRAMLYHDRAIFTDLDQNLLGNTEDLPELIRVLREHRHTLSFGIATGRRLDSALKVMKKHGIPEPDVLITSGGTSIHYAPELTEDRIWTHHVEKQWTPQVVRRVLSDLPGIELQPRAEQSRFKISYYIDPSRAPDIEKINQLLHQEEQSVNVYISFGQFLDVMPIRASKGLALRYFANRWDIPLEKILVAGGSGTDEDMMRGNTLAVVLANRHHEELSQLEDIERIYFAEHAYARGILEALEHYDFFNSCHDPDQAEPN